jgi:hypothetical protein
MTMLNRSTSNASPDLALTEVEIGLLDHLKGTSKNSSGEVAANLTR